MAKYTSMSSLKKAMQKALVPATNMMAEKVMHKVDEKVIDYYLDYTPKFYDRTGTMSYVPHKLEAIGEGDTATTYVYPDLSYEYNTGTWGMPEVWDSANNRLHGGKKLGSGVAVWDEPMEESNNESRAMWKEALSAAGLNVK